MRIQWFVIGDKPMVCVTADTRSMCQRIAFEIASELPADVVVAPFKERDPNLWTQGFSLEGIDCAVAARAIEAGIRFVCFVLKGTALTPVEGTPIELIEETKP